VKVTASTAKLQHVLNMTDRLRQSFLPLISLAEQLGNTDTTADAGTDFCDDFAFVKTSFNILHTSIGSCEVMTYDDYLEPWMIYWMICLQFSYQFDSM